MASITMTSAKLVPAAISVKPMYWPAEAMISALATVACVAVIPAFFAAMPRAIDTAKYPSMIGMPSFKPLTNHFFRSVSMVILLRLCVASILHRIRGL